jgi:hypothetical protein
MIEYITFAESLLTDKEWDAYVENADNGTLFHTRKFLSYHRQSKFIDASLIFRKKERIIALLPAALKETGGEKVFFSHPGASWGGLVWQEPLKYSETKEICEKVTAFAQSLKCHRIEITLSPLIYQKTPNDYLSFVLLQLGYIYGKRELSNVINLDSIDLQTLLNNKSVKQGVNQTKRLNIEIEKDSDDWESFYELLRILLEKKGKKPTHSLADLRMLKRMFPKDILLWTAYEDGKLVGGRCNWRVQKGIWLFFYSACIEKYRSKRVITRLYYESICDFIREKAHYVDMGTSSINMEVNDGLISFKENFSAYGIFRDTLIKNL